MSEFPKPGTPVTVILRAGAGPQWRGEIAAVRDGGLAVRVAGEMPAWDGRAVYVIVAQRGTERLRLEGVYIGHTGSAVAFRALGAWQPVNRRAHPRFAAGYRAEVRSVLGTSRQDGQLVDISLGGAAVRVESRPGGRQVLVRVYAGAFSSELLCDVVGADEGNDGTVLHLSFAELAPAQRAFVRQIVEELSGQERQAS